MSISVLFSSKCLALIAGLREILLLSNMKKILLLLSVSFVSFLIDILQYFY